MPVRDQRIAEFLDRSGWDSAQRLPLAGDASSRRYERLKMGDQQAILMDAPSFADDPLRQNEIAYMEKAALAVNISPFVAIDDWLRGLGLGAPDIFACDLENGLLLLEDLGDLSLGQMVEEDHKDLEEAYGEAVRTLIKLHRTRAPKSLPIRGGGHHHLPPYHMEIMHNELRMLFEWYIPEHRAAPVPEHEVENFWRIWTPLLTSQMDGLDPAVLLRDYHTPNIQWRPERTGPNWLGIIDFQDALIGTPAHDLMSLLQDARKDLPENFEPHFLQMYLAERQADIGFDGQAFQRSYAIIGALRNIRLLGLWVRLPKRDGKKQYAAHLPRAWRHVEKNLRHPALSDLRAWMDKILPSDSRCRDV